MWYETSGMELCSSRLRSTVITWDWALPVPLSFRLPNAPGERKLVYAFVLGLCSEKASDLEGKRTSEVIASSEPFDGGRGLYLEYSIDAS